MGRPQSCTASTRSTFTTPVSVSTTTLGELHAANAVPADEQIAGGARIPFVVRRALHTMRDPIELRAAHRFCEAQRLRRRAPRVNAPRLEDNLIRRRIQNGRDALCEVARCAVSGVARRRRQRRGDAAAARRRTRRKPRIADMSADVFCAQAEFLRDDLREHRARPGADVLRAAERLDRAVAAHTHFARSGLDARCTPTATAPSRRRASPDHGPTPAACDPSTRSARRRCVALRRARRNRRSRAYRSDPEARPDPCQGDAPTHRAPAPMQRSPAPGRARERRRRGRHW